MHSEQQSKVWVSSSDDLFVEFELQIVSLKGWRQRLLDYWFYSTHIKYQSSHLHLVVSSSFQLWTNFNHQSWTFDFGCIKKRKLKVNLVAPLNPVIHEHQQDQKFVSELICVCNMPHLKSKLTLISVVSLFLTFMQKWTTICVNHTAIARKTTQYLPFWSYA